MNCAITSCWLSTAILSLLLTLSVPLGKLLPPRLVDLVAIKVERDVLHLGQRMLLRGKEGHEEHSGARGDEHVREGQVDLVPAKPVFTPIHMLPEGAERPVAGAPAQQL